MKKTSTMVQGIAMFVTILVATFVCGCGGNNAELARAQATSAYLAGDWAQTVKEAQQWVERDSTDPIPHALMNIAYTRLEMHELVKAELALAYNSTDRQQKVKIWAMALAATYGTNPRAHLLEGIVHEIMEDNQEAITSYRKAIEVDPAFNQSYESLGNLYMSTGQLEEALKVFTVLSERNPNYSAAYDHIATVYVMADQMPLAVANFEKAVKLDPKDATSLYNLASAYMQTGATEKAVVTLHKVSELDPVGEIGKDAREKLDKLRQ